MRIQLSRMERLAASGVIFRFRRELDTINARRDRDMAEILVEHGVHNLPDTYQVDMDDDGYVRAISWNEEEACDA